MAPVDVYQFQGQAAHRLNQQHVIQPGLRKGMTVLLYYRLQEGACVNQVFQAVLVAQKSITNPAQKMENKLWKQRSLHGYRRALPGLSVGMLYARTRIASISPLTNHMELERRSFQANVLIEDMVFLGDTRSAEELAVYTNMAPERLCLGCGLRVEEKFTPISPRERGRLFAASVKLLQVALRAVDREKRGTVCACT